MAVEVSEERYERRRAPVTLSGRGTVRLCAREDEEGARGSRAARVVTLGGRPVRTTVAPAALACSVAFAVAAAILLLAYPGGARNDFGPPGWTLLFGLTNAVVGYVVATRRGENPVGWAMLVAGVSQSFDGLLREYGLRDAALGGGLPAAALATWADGWLYVVGTTATALAFLLFPDGRPVSPRWAAVVPLSIAFGAITVVVTAVLPATFQANGLPNPFGLEALRGIAVPVGTVVSMFPPVPVVLAAGSLLVRYRRSGAVVRQQIKWVAVAALVATGSVVNVVLPGVKWLEYWILAAATVPVAIGIAILRYRLYDIDLLINRTLVYGALSAALVATYLAVVVLFQAALRPFTAGNELAVAGSTLATLALVQPLRRRVQDAVDRHFYRSRYDAARTLDAFSIRLRDEVDLDEVRADLIGAVGETVRPAHASVWLRAPREAAR